MNETKVVHCKIEPFDVYIGRPSEWGNPFTHKAGTMAQAQCSTVAEAVQKYREWINTQPQLLAKIPELKGKTLGCWCKTKKNPNAPCHGDVLVELAEQT
jgi:hypothetical protein